MDFIDQVKQFSKRVESVKDGITTEEATKMSIIVPFFAMLGYDVFNPDEFLPEFTADVGIKKGEKVDYAILKDGQPMILIEAKWCGEKLDKHDSQLYRYFGTTKAKFAILTNGLIYKFFTDLDEPNKMDEKPFLTIDILNIKDNQIPELKKFTKSSFDIESIFDTASELKYSNEFKAFLAKELQEPTDDFVKLFLSNVYSGVKTQNVIDKFRPILKKALNNYISELMSDKIKSALSGDEIQTEQQNIEVDTTENEEPSKTKNIVTTDEELEAYFIIKNLLKDTVSMEEITYRDTLNYINVLYKDNGRKWICRLVLTDNKKELLLPDENKNSIKYTLNNIYDLENYKEQLIEVLNRYL
ncbi:type I restriction endonuclease [Massilioclostridium coli]|uniref:type I restriction endonuclease n=1 Tax=Massilioclostridium coli TaxID=1870991 RepID=UPI0022E59130|nr:type I restriction endonuclease [Massilioclostridium coli]